MSSIFSAFVFVILAGLGVSWPEFGQGEDFILKNLNSGEIDYSALKAGVFGAVSEKPELKQNPFEKMELEAKSAAVIDLVSGEAIFTKEADAERPLASLTKLVTAAVIDDIVSGVADENEKVIMVQPAVNQTGDDGFFVGETFIASDLRDAMLVKSSNDAAQALVLWAESLQPEKAGSYWFVNKMNLFVSELGMHKTRFLNATGLDLGKNVSGSYGTARETAELFSWLIKNKPGLLGQTNKSSMSVYSIEGREHVFETSADRLMAVPELIAAKTGFTDLAGGNVVFAFALGPGHQFAAVVLGSSYDGRFEDALKIYAAAKERIKP
ncbi:MAG: D-alanyl-D-alanine carboxypeptidase [Candidatus Niyogibacteria bacterium]|nr:D-alanyl-D-alanine carboxypeptidase [Candidatus Niyogibacteria bacterium]